MAHLVVGGAGYIGSHMVKRLLASGEDVVVLDNLSKGHRAAAGRADFVRGDLLDRNALDELFASREIEAVYHFAALAYVGESVQDPATYYENNVTGSINLLEAMRAAGVGKIVFSSTAAVYGEPEKSPIAEDVFKDPINPYGRTKLAIEWLLEDYARAYGLKFAALRYFNAAGASSDASIGEDHEPETHLVPIILDVALGKRDHITVFGDDYPTPDGTCVRDYIHVEDLAEAHVLAMKEIDNRNLNLNLGTGSGYSVKQVIDVAEKVTGRNIPREMGARRPGDPPELVASADRAGQILGWTPRVSDLETIIETAWKWHKSHPDGYGE